MSVASQSSDREARPWLAHAVLGLLALLLLSTFASEATACDLRLSRAPQAVRIEYDPFVIARPPGRLDMEVANDGDTACEVELRLRDLTGERLRTLALGGVGLEFRAREGGAVVIDGAEPGVFRLFVTPGAVSDVELDVRVVADAVAEAGDHQASLLFDIGPAGGEPLIRAAPVDVILSSPPRAQMNIAGAAGAFGSGDSVEVVDFGDARTGTVKRVFLQVRANTEARLTFQSGNAGVLRPAGSRSEESVIAYEVALDGETLNLRHPAVRDVDPPRDVRGQSMPLDFTLGSVGSQWAGEYEDLLTISISPR